MTFEELNSVRRLRKKLGDAQQKLQALALSMDSITPQFTRGEDGYTCFDTSPKAKSTTSRPENITVLLSEAELRVARIQSELDKEIISLTDKIQREVTDENDQALILHRYVGGKYFRDIGFLMGISEAHVYFTHRRVLKRLLQ